MDGSFCLNWKQRNQECVDNLARTTERVKEKTTPEKSNIETIKQTFSSNYRIRFIRIHSFIQYNWIVIFCAQCICCRICLHSSESNGNSIGWKSVKCHNAFDSLFIATSSSVRPRSFAVNFHRSRIRFARETSSICHCHRHCAFYIVAHIKHCIRSMCIVQCCETANSLGVCQPISAAIENQIFLNRIPNQCCVCVCAMRCLVLPLSQIPWTQIVYEINLSKSHSFCTRINFLIKMKCSIVFMQIKRMFHMGSTKLTRFFCCFLCLHFFFLVWFPEREKHKYIPKQFPIKSNADGRICHKYFSFLHEN